jgi:hypothetical protein
MTFERRRIQTHPDRRPRKKAMSSMTTTTKLRLIESFEDCPDLRQMKDRTQTTKPAEGRSEKCADLKLRLKIGLVFQFY